MELGDKTNNSAEKKNFWDFMDLSIRKMSWKQKFKATGIYLGSAFVAAAIVLPVISYHPMERLIATLSRKTYQQQIKDQKNYRVNQLMNTFDLDSNGVIDTSEVRYVIDKDSGRMF